MRQTPYYYFFGLLTETCWCIVFWGYTLSQCIFKKINDVQVWIREKSDMIIIYRDKDKKELIYVHDWQLHPSIRHVRMMSVKLWGVIQIVVFKFKCQLILVLCMDKYMEFRKFFFSITHNLAHPPGQICCVNLRLFNYLDSSYAGRLAHLLSKNCRNCKRRALDSRPAHKKYKFDFIFENSPHLIKYEKI